VQASNEYLSRASVLVGGGRARGMAKHTLSDVHS
jgi:hypothetical protein